MRLHRRSTAYLVILLAMTACGENAGGNTTAATGEMIAEGGTANCGNKPGLDSYSANLKKAGTRRAFTFTLIESSPAPPARGDNVFKLEIAQADGTALARDLRTTIDMPEHGHRSLKTPIVTFDTSTATYTVDPAFLSMPGVWRIEFEAYDDSDAGTALDSAVFQFCVEG